MLKKNFDQTVVETTTLEPNTTTTEKYRISRQEFGKLLNKNFRGIQKLMRIELADAKNVIIISNATVSNS